MERCRLIHNSEKPYFIRISLRNHLLADDALRVNEYLETSTRKGASQLGMSKYSLQRIIKKDLQTISV